MFLSVVRGRGTGLCAPQHFLAWHSSWQRWLLTDLDLERENVALFVWLCKNNFSVIIWMEPLLPRKSILQGWHKAGFYLLAQPKGVYGV